MTGQGLIYSDNCEELCAVMEKGGSDMAEQIFGEGEVLRRVSQHKGAAEAVRGGRSEQTNSRAN